MILPFSDQRKTPCEVLSPAKWHTLLSKDRAQNEADRLYILQRAESDPLLRKALLDACRDDLLFYINFAVWQFNPKKKGVRAVGPFLTWGFQEEALLGTPETTATRGLLWCYEHNRSAVVEKSREMGATWLFLIFEDWLALFHPYTQALNISKSADAVDCKSRDSLFEKVRFMHRYLPDWLKGEITEQKMYFEYHRTQSEVTGEASTGRAGVSGRASLIFVDEFSKIKEAREVRQRTASTADCRFFNSTHEGEGTEFFKLCQTPEFVKIVMHWTQHPEKWPGAYRYIKDENRIEVLDHAYRYPSDFNFVYSEAPLGGPFPGVRSPWYDRMDKEIGDPRAMAVEHDIDVSGSVTVYFHPLELRTLKAEFSCKPYWQGDIGYDKDSGQPLGLIRLPEGPLKLWVHPKADGSLPAAVYTMGSDIGEGNGATSSCLTVTNAQTGEKVAEWATADRKPWELAPVFCAIGRMFKDEYDCPAHFAWEHHGPGRTFGDCVMKLGYRPIYWREGEYRVGKSVSLTPGWHPSGDTKRDLLDAYRAALYGHKFINRSEWALKECSGYYYGAGGYPECAEEVAYNDPSGARINHGDRVIADALSWMMVRKLGIVAAKKDELPEFHEGSLAWRRQYRERRQREAELV